MFSVLKALGVHDVYGNALGHMSKHGYSQYMTFDPYTGEINVWGAILLACGGKQKHLRLGAEEPEECGVIPKLYGVARVSCEYLEAVVNEDISRWCETHEYSDAKKLLRDASERVEISISSF
jgi:hypothetical protein